MSLSFMISSSSPSTVTSVPDHLPNRILSPALTAICDQLAAVFARAFADRNDLAFGWLLFCAFRDDKTAFGRIVAFYAADQYAVVQRSKCHIERSLVQLLVDWHSSLVSANDWEIRNVPAPVNQAQGQNCSGFHSFAGCPRHTPKTMGIARVFLTLSQSQSGLSSA